MTLTVDNKRIVVPDAVRRKAGLRRGDQIEFKVSGRAITIAPTKPTAKEYPIRTVTRIVKEAKNAPMTAAESAEADRELAAYGAMVIARIAMKIENRATP
jgi:AbrB family looped-hinge helix DNA binding protein